MSAVTELFEASMDEVIAAARLEANEAIAWNEVPAERIATALASVKW